LFLNGHVVSIPGIYLSPSNVNLPRRAQLNTSLGYGFSTETAKFLGFGLVSVMAVTRIFVSAWFWLQP